MADKRLVSIAAGVTPELNADPARFVSAAAVAGWPATGIWFDAASWTAATTAQVRRHLDHTGMIAVDMEVVRMGPKGDCGKALIEAAAEIGAQNVLSISSFAEPEETASRFAELCQLAEPAGIRVCIEFMRFTTVRTLADALDIIHLADQPNSGVLVDLLHVARSGTSLDEISRADPALFPYAQWCDGPAQPRGWENADLIADALDDRSAPGEGDLPVSAFERLFVDSVPFSVEVRSKALRTTFPDPVERARHLLARTRAALNQT